MADTDVDFPFPVLSPQATEEEKNLSLKEKLNLVDNEIRQLYEFCTKAGYTQPQIEQCAQPLLALQSREKHIKWFWRLFSLALVVAFVAFLFAYDPTYRRICIYGKSVAMKVKKVYSRYCLYQIHGSILPVTMPPGQPGDKSVPGVGNCLKPSCPGGRGVGQVKISFLLFL